MKLGAGLREVEEMSGGKVEKKEVGQEKNVEVKGVKEVEKKENGIWKPVEVKEIEEIFERRAFRAKNWNTQKLREDLEKLEPKKIYETTVQEFVKKYGKDGIKKLTIQGQKKKIRQVLRRMGDYFELKVSIEGNVVKIVKLS